MNIVSLQQESVSHNVEYIRNCVRFVATNHQEADLISKLHATGLAVDAESFNSGDQADTAHNKTNTDSDFGKVADNETVV